MYSKLRSFRVEKGMSVEKMGRKLGISRAFYWQIEKGTRRLSYDMAVKIAQIFNIKPDYLFYNDHIKNKES